MNALADRLRRAARHLPLLLRALALVWEAAPRRMAAWGALLLVQSLIPVGQVLLTRRVVDSLAAALGRGLSWEVALPPLLWAALIGALMLLSQVLGGLTGWVHAQMSELVRDTLTQRLHQQSIRLSYAWFEKSEYYDRLYRAQAAGGDLPLSQVSALGSLIQSGLTLVSMGAVLLQYGVLLPLLLLVVTIPTLWIVIRNSRQTYAWSRRVTPHYRRVYYYDWLLTARENAAELRLFGLWDYWRTAYERVRKTLREERLGILRRQTWSSLLANLLGMLSAGAGLLWMGARGLLGAVSLGDLALFYQAFNQGQSLARNLLNNAGQVYTNLLYLGDFFEFLDLRPTPAEVRPPEEPLPDAETIQRSLLTAPVEVRLENIRFAYPDSSQPAVEDLSLVLPAGRITAIVGDNGAGKSTLLKLICRLHDPQDGRILWNRLDTRLIQPEALRSQVSVLMQFPQEYQETVSANIQTGHLPADQAGIQRSAHSAGADDFIRQLPQQYDTLLGRWFETGTDLSAGQWQRLALARALLRPASLLLLDEPTSSLDAWSEADWYQRLHEARAGRTTLIITHRLSTARQADLICVMSQGRIVESGPHAELLRLNGRYAQAWHSQRWEDDRG